MSDQILWDCHMHSSFSADSDTSMEEMIQKAITCGLSGICFTEHLDPDYPETPDHIDFSLDIPSYQGKLYSLRDTYRDKLDIRFGIELGLQTHLEDYFHNLLKETPFDFVIGSSHTVHGYDPYYPDFFRGRREFSAYMEYFESILENIASFSEMDVYGHIDYVVRYGPNKNREYSYNRYQDILDEILRRLISKGIGIELNTGGYHYGLGEPNPCTAIIRRYRQLGGEIITIGADAHAPDKIAFSFDKAAEVLRQCGFSYYTVFRNRKPEFIRL
ncbi:MAG: histidinol-phosphatase HisJ family protein [Blautia sp.]|nr:histidinol-phosphatase HisJ family protein [Blautia sp.]MDY3998313.1 histidinol-phosphatase HisJ family protein [Blautia sp.]